jgi:hypothetical protein
VGVNMWGATTGIELKPIPNSYLRFEARHLNEIDREGDIFYFDKQFRKSRNEFVLSTGFWF